MGGRGAYYSGQSKNYETREYDTVGEFEGIKIIKSRGLQSSSKSTLPMHSQTSDVYILKSGDDIRKIGFYENNNLVRSIDLDDKSGVIAAHEWKLTSVTDGYPKAERDNSQGGHLALTNSEYDLIKRLLGDKLFGKKVIL